MMREKLSVIISIQASVPHFLSSLNGGVAILLKKIAFG
jgi:hypothetical protein